MNRFPFTGIRNRDRLQIITHIMVADKVFKLRNDVRNSCTIFHFEDDLASIIEDNVADIIDKSLMDRF